jgi:hypothetical protein
MVGTANSLNLGEQPRDASRSSTTKKKSVSARGRLAETRGGFAGHAARANALLNAVTLPPVTRLTFSYRYSRFLVFFLKNVLLPLLARA